MEINATDIVQVIQYTMSVLNSIHADSIEDMKKIVRAYEANNDLLGRIINSAQQSEEQDA